MKDHEPREILLRITARHFCAGAIFQIQASEWVCVRAAPILGYMVGWDSKKVKDYCQKKGWEHERSRTTRTDQ
jgi:hypothetical protein